MLVIISDLHLTDETSGSTVDPGAFEIFAHRLQEFAMRASWRADGHYQPIDRVDLVLLGDVLDLTRSNQWLRSTSRPWDSCESPQMLETVNSVVDGALTSNASGLSILRSLGVEGSLCVSPADHSGTPVYAAEGHPVPVRIHYMVGNHDWMLHLPGSGFDLLRQKVAHHMGLANRHNEPFPHDAMESEELLGALRRHRVLARHGDIFDPLNFAEDRDMSSLGDAIVVELVNRFVSEIREEMGEDLPPAVMQGLEQIDNIRPLLLIPVWIEGLLERCCAGTSGRRKIKRTWDRLVDEFLNLRMVRDRDTWSPFDLVDGLEVTLKFSKRMSLGWATKISTWLQSLRGASGDSYQQHALNEQDFRNRRARHIVYGHTHHAESIPLDASYADGFVLNQMYFNSGTWRRVFRPTQWAPSEHEFIPADTMSVLAFFQGDERSGRAFESWSGMLGARASEFTKHRVDSGQASHATQQSVPSSNVSFSAPHFAPQSGSSRVAPVRRI